MKRIVPLVIAVLLVAAVAAVVVVRAARARRVDDRVRGSGSIEATEVDVAPKIAARIAALTVDEGAHVAAGQPLVELACDVQQAQLAQAQAQLEQAEAALTQAKARERQASLGLAPLRVQLGLAQKERARSEHLFETGGVTRSQHDQAVAAAEGLDKQVQAALEGVTVAHTGVVAVQAQIAQAAAGLALARSQVDECTLSSPLTGVVMRKDHEPGELVLPGSTVYVLGRLDDVYTWIYVPNEEVGRVRIGQRADVVADTYPGRTFPGTVVHVNEQAEFTPKSIQTKADRTRLVFGVKVAVKNGTGALLPGMPVEAVLEPGR